MGVKPWGYAALDASLPSQVDQNSYTRETSLVLDATMYVRYLRFPHPYARNMHA
jgi:hypothetical protein